MVKKMNQEKISKTIKEARIKSGLTQKEFAEKYAVTYQAVSKWENGKNIPDISILREICKDFNLDINEIMNNPINKRGNINKYIILAIIVLIGLTCILFFLTKTNKDFEFKTLSANCPNFKVSGNISYSDKKSAIYISNVTYCGGDDIVEYQKIECKLFEKKDNVSIEISSYAYDGKTKLEDFLKNVNFVIDNYKGICKNYDKDSLFLSIKATSNDKVVEYEIPLSLNDDCK